MKKEKQIQIDRSLFLALCEYFELIDSNRSSDELTMIIKNGLDLKIQTILRRAAYSEILKTEQGSEERENAILDYLQLKDGQ